MAVRPESFFSMAVSLYKILSWARSVGMLQVLVSSWMHFFRYSHAVLVYSGQLIAWRKASTVAKALWGWMGSGEVGSGLREGMMIDLSRRNQQEKRQLKNFCKGFHCKFGQLTTTAYNPFRKLCCSSCSLWPSQNLLQHQPKAVKGP